MSNSKHDDSKGGSAQPAKKGHVELSDDELQKVSGGTQTHANSKGTLTNSHSTVSNSTHGTVANSTNTNKN